MPSESPVGSGTELNKVLAKGSEMRASTDVSASWAMLAVVVLLLAACGGENGGAGAVPGSGQATEWTAYGGGKGLRYSPLADITRENLQRQRSPGFTTRGTSRTERGPCSRPRPTR